MFRSVLLLLAAAIPAAAIAGERIAGQNFYVIHTETWNTGMLTYWRQDNRGTFQVSEGPIAPGFVQCVGAGFGGPTGVTGEGICIFGRDNDTFTWRWQAHADGPNTWTVIDATGRYEGMRGSGTAKSRVQSEKLKIQHRVTDWEGEIELPGR